MPEICLVEVNGASGSEISCFSSPGASAAGAPAGDGAARWFSGLLL